ncbi:MAG: ATP-binding cassette domain-containing protein [Thermoguttaceae bacterium]|jgi:ABC-2 type transport system ATP-binding protein
METIRTERLTKTFGDLTAVAELTLAVSEGEIFGLVGPDGSGKTTTMRLLTAIMDPTSGDAWVAGRHVVGQAEAVKEQIGYMSQRFGLYTDLTVMENLNFYADIYNVPHRGRQERIDRLLAFSNLAPFKRRLAGALSGGMKQKLGLACALIHTPKVLFLDEPTNGVDPVSRRDFWRILYQLLREKVTIFLSTAYLDEAERCHRVALIHRGRLLACDTPNEVRKLMRGEILEVRSRNPRNTAALLRERCGANRVGLFGDRVHVVGDTPAETRRQIEEILAAAGQPMVEIRPIAPSLEDVFVSVLGAESSHDITSPRENDFVGRIANPSHSAQHPAHGQRLPFPTPADASGAPGEAAVTVENLQRRFGSFVAVDRISFSVRRGEIFGFLGPNGAGKSTTIRMLCGILLPSGGTGSVAGFDIRTQQERIKAHIGYMSQKFSLYQDLTVEENIDFYSGIYNIPPHERAARKQWVIDMAGLADHRRQPTGILSGGWKQRLALGCAILHQPPILFLDEPTSGVDPLSRRRFWDLIYDMSGQGVTIFVTTHYMDEAEYCDRLGLIYRGELIAVGTPETLKRDVMQEDVLEVSCAQPEAVLEDLSRLPLVREAALFGNGLHVVTGDADRTAAEVRRLFDERGQVVQRIEKIQPSLEDVFVSLIEARDRSEEPQAEVAR